MNETVCTLFARQAAQRPDAPAVTDERRTLTYAELDALAETLLSAFPTPAPRHVGILLNHGAEMIAALLNGAVLAIPSEETKADMGRLMRFVERQGVTIVSGFPYLLLEMNKLPAIPSCLRLLISGGDVLRACAEVECGAVCPYTDTQGLSYLVAYVVPRSGTFSLAELKRKIAENLTSFMIPEYFVAMPALPLTPNGKIDRRALPVILKEGTL